MPLFRANNADKCALIRFFAANHARPHRNMLGWLLTFRAHTQTYSSSHSSRTTPTFTAAFGNNLTDFLVENQLAALLAFLLLFLLLLLLTTGVNSSARHLLHHLLPRQLLQRQGWVPPLVGHGFRGMGGGTATGSSMGSSANASRTGSSAATSAGASATALLHATGSSHFLQAPILHRQQLRSSSRDDNLIQCSLNTCTANLLANL